MIPRLWYITDGLRGTAGRPISWVIRSAADGGVQGVVLRERDASTARQERLIRAVEPLRARGVRVLVSRRLDLARAYGLDGVHLAADAAPIAEARAWLGPDAVIGYSAHSEEDARAAAEQGASFVTLSPIYSTDSKPGARGQGLDWLADAIRELPIPALGLGGVTPERTRGILKTGAWGVAAVSAIGAVPNVAGAAESFARAIQETTA